MNTQTIRLYFSLMEQFTHLRATWTSFGDMEFLSYHHRCSIMKEEFQLYVGVGARPSTCRHFKYMDNIVNSDSIKLMDVNPGKIYPYFYLLETQLILHHSNCTWMWYYVMKYSKLYESHFSHLKQKLSYKSERPLSFTR